MSDAHRQNAEAVLDRLEATLDAFLAAPDAPGQRIHSLFAGLYRETSTQWLKALAALPDPDLPYLVMRHFFELYDEGVLAHLRSPITDIPPQWRRYHRLARRLTMRSPISLHLILISLGVRAHIRHDLGLAIDRAMRSRPEGSDPSARLRQQLVGTLSARAFLRAALDFVDWHRQRRSGWRWAVLGLYSAGLRLLKPVWVGVVEAWRMAAIEEGLRLPAPAAAARGTGLPARRSAAREDRAGKAPD